MCAFGIMDKPKRAVYQHIHADQDWLAATSRVPDVDVPPTVAAEEDLEDVWTERERALFGNMHIIDFTEVDDDLQIDSLGDWEVAAEQVSLCMHDPIY